MGVASMWRREKGEAGAFKSSRSKAGDPFAAEKISRRITDELNDVAKIREDGESFNTALARLNDGLRQRVTFRRPVMVKAWVKGARWRKGFDKLPNVHVGAGARGIVKMVMVDGRALVKLNNYHEVLAFVGKDCKILRWWHKVIDWFKKAEVAEMNQSFE